MKGTGTLVVFSIEVSLEVNAEKSVYKFIFCHRNAGQNCNTDVNCGKVLYTYLGIPVTNQNCILEEIKVRLYSENAFCHSS
jgi:hypothetical protein